MLLKMNDSWPSKGSRPKWKTQAKRLDIPGGYYIFSLLWWLIILFVTSYKICGVSNQNIIGFVLL